MLKTHHIGIAAALAALMAAPLPAVAQEASPPSGIEHSFNLESQPLRSAIDRFSRQTGIAVISDGAIPSHVQSGAVVGTMTSTEALKRLLAGSGIRYEFTGASAIVLHAVGSSAEPAGGIELSTINVEADNPNSTMTLPPVYAGGQVATGGQLGLLGNRSVMDTPFNQTSYTSELIQNQQARKLDDVLADNPSIRPNAPRAYGFDFFSMRGFDVASTAYGINGLYGIASNYSFNSLAAVERVEVLLGPATLLNGMPPAGGVGGSINLVTKRAGDDPITQLTTTYASASQFGAELDVGRRYGENNEFGIRFNGSYEDGDTALDYQSQQLTTAALNLDYRGERVRVSFDGGFEKNNIDAMTRYVTFGNLPAAPVAPDAKAAFMPSWAYWNGEGHYAIAQGEVDITDDITAYAQAGLVGGAAEYLYSDIRVTNLNGNFSGSPRLNSQERDQYAVQGGFRASLETGFVSHELNFNAATSWGETSIINTTGTPFTSNLYDPVQSPTPFLSVGEPFRVSTVRLGSFGIADTMSILDERVQFTVGIRRQQVETGNYNQTSQIASYEDSAWSPGYAIVVKPWENVSLYANYVEGLEAGTTVGSQYENAGEVLPPYKAEQFEVGIKVDWGTLTTTLSAFDIKRPLQLVTPDNVLTQDGERRNRGIELNVFGEVTEGVRLLGGVMLLDARQEKTVDGEYDGNRVFGVSDVQFNLSGEWDLPFVPGLTLTGRVIHNSNFYANAANTQLVPSWTRYDVGARYEFLSPWNNKPIVARFSVENVLDSNYWQGANTDGYVFLGAPRTYLVSTTFNF